MNGSAAGARASGAGQWGSKGRGQFVPITWDEVLDTIIERWQAIRLGDIGNVPTFCDTLVEVAAAGG